MYSPNLFTNSLFTLWNVEDIRPEDNGGQVNEQSNEEQRKQLRQLFAPPLLAYSADYPGASVNQLEYTIQNTTAFPGYKHYRPQKTAKSLLIQLKIDQLEQIRTTGYSTLRPIGIEKTMNEVEFEKSHRSNASDTQYEDQAYFNTAENSNTEVTGGTGINGSSILQLQSEIDLDAQIYNADDSDEDLDVAFAEGDLQTIDGSDVATTIPNSRHVLLQHQEAEQGHLRDTEDEGFMAEEVEYQDDHSITADANQNILINSGAGSTTTGSSSNFNTGRTATTNFTTLNSIYVDDADNLYSSSRTHEERDAENSDDNYDMDMVIEEN